MRTELLVSRKLFSLSPQLLKALQLRQANLPADPVAILYDAFLLDPGFGPPTWITSDGRILWEDAPLWDCRGTLGDALIGVSAGILKTGIELLKTILPPQSVFANASFRVSDV